jgi:hypothetical protein
MELFIGTFHGRFECLEAIELVAVVISDKTCFELLDSSRWVCDTANDSHQMPDNE